jgi:hypothetical protein
VQTCLIVAGLGALSALGGAYYLERDVEVLSKEFDGRPFACVISVKKSVSGPVRSAG